MKKIIAVIITLLLLASVLTANAFALTISSDDVIRIYGLKADDTKVILDGSKSFAEGWEMAVDYARDDDYMDENAYDRIVVELLADWKANGDGEFGDSWRLGTDWGDGFQYSTIFIPADTRMTVNMNGHTIDRGLTKCESDGEVICIGDDADVIINDGTVTGGFSSNGAGGIHIKDDATVTLNNVNVVKNKVDDDDGAAIAVCEGATLTMIGGCVSHNTSYDDVYGGGVYVDEGRAFFTNVIFEDNHGLERNIHGAVLYVDDGTVVMDGCKVIGNGMTRTSDGEERFVAYSIISILDGSSVMIKDTTFSGNGYPQEAYVDRSTLKYTTVISSKASYLTIEKCSFTDNKQVYLIESEATVLNASDTDFSGNDSLVFYGNCAVGTNSAFIDCIFGRGKPTLSQDYTFFFNLSNAGLSFIDCDLGEASFNNRSAVQLADTNSGVGSIFTEPNLSNIFVFLSLGVSAVSICLSFILNRKKSAPAAENNSAGDVTEE